MNKSFRKTITWAIIGVLTAFTAIVYVCPMGRVTQFSAKTATLSVCQKMSVAPSQSFGMPDNCMNTHLATAGLTKSSLPDRLILFFVALLLVAVLGVAQKIFLPVNVLLDRWRYFFRRYRQKIKFLVLQKFLKYFNSLHADPVVSLA